MSNLFAAICCHATLFAAKTDQQRFDEAMAQERFITTISIIGACVGIAIVAASIPISFILDRRKKARRKAAEEEL